MFANVRPARLAPHIEAQDKVRAHTFDPGRAPMPAPKRAAASVPASRALSAAERGTIRKLLCCHHAWRTYREAHALTLDRASPAQLLAACEHLGVDVEAACRAANKAAANAEAAEAPRTRRRASASGAISEGERCRRQRAILRLTQAEVAAAMGGGATAAQVSAFERMSPDFLARYLRAIGTLAAPAFAFGG